MRRPSLQGCTCSVPCVVYLPGQIRSVEQARLYPSTHEGLRRSPEHYFAGDIHMSMTALNTSVPARSRTLTVTGSA